MTDGLPAPDHEVVPRHGSKAIADVIYSSDGLKRIVITRDERDMFYLHAEVWDTSDWEVCGWANWVIEGWGSLTDSLAHARELAAELLA